MRSLFLFFGLLFLTAHAIAEKPVEDTELSPLGEEMEAGREVEAEEAVEADQLMLNEDAPQDFLLAGFTSGRNRKPSYKRCSCRITCPVGKRRGRCLKDFSGYLCCFS